MISLFLSLIGMLLIQPQVCHVKPVTIRLLLLFRRPYHSDSVSTISAYSQFSQVAKVLPARTSLHPVCAMLTFTYWPSCLYVGLRSASVKLISSSVGRYSRQLGTTAIPILPIPISWLFFPAPSYRHMTIPAILGDIWRYVCMFSHKNATVCTTRNFKMFLLQCGL